MTEEVESVLRWGWRGLGLLGVVAVVIGGLSAAAPRRSIRLYQWIMERFNWRVSPIDEAREMRNTRLLGVFLILLSVALLWQVCLRWRLLYYAS